jgi:hypothetical protein
LEREDVMGMTGRKIDIEIIKHWINTSKFIHREVIFGPQSKWEEAMDGLTTHQAYIIARLLNMISNEMTNAQDLDYDLWEEANAPAPK